MQQLAFLRGVNVGGKNRLRMEELRKALEADGFSSVSSYLQSGNVLFSGPQTAQDVSRVIRAAFGLDIAVLLRTPGELAAILQATPYPAGECYVTFLQGVPGVDALQKALAADGKGSVFTPAGREVYVLPGGEYHKTVYSNAFFEKKLGLAATTRNARVLGSLLALCQTEG